MSPINPNCSYGYKDFLKSERKLLDLFIPDSAAALASLSSLCTSMTCNSLSNDVYFLDKIFIKEKNMMTLFNWFLVSKFEEGKEPIKSGFITSVDEESAREYIVRSFDKGIFEQYKDGEFALVIVEVDSWGI